MSVIPSLSTEYIKVPLADPTWVPSAVDVAVTTYNSEPLPTEWQAAEVVEGEVRFLVGPDSGFPLEDGHYSVWVRFTSSPENPVRNAGSVWIS